ncbi:hypothetical protein [Asanoa hainanensis]|nr:hypothetical protein [Asanoa hainanensis]
MTMTPGSSEPGPPDDTPAGPLWLNPSLRASMDARLRALDHHLAAGDGDGAAHDLDTLAATAARIARQLRGQDAQDGTIRPTISVGTGPLDAADTVPHDPDDPREHNLAVAGRIADGDAASPAAVAALAQGLLDIAQLAMPDTYFATDSRCQLARAVLAATAATPNQG